MTKSRTICVLDDDRSAALLAERAIASAGHEVRAFTDPNLAREYIRINRTDLIVVDLVMEEVTGIDMMRWARTQNPFLRMIAMTGCASVQTLLDCWRIGADCCVLKGSDFADELLREVDVSLRAIERWENSIRRVRDSLAVG